MRYLVIVEKTRSGFSAYAPDLPGCIATGATEPQVRRAIGSAIQMHLEGLKEDQEPIPPALASGYQWNRQTKRVSKLKPTQVRVPRAASRKGVAKKADPRPR